MKFGAKKPERSLTSFAISSRKCLLTSNATVRRVCISFLVMIKAVARQAIPAVKGLSVWVNSKLSANDSNLYNNFSNQLKVFLKKHA